MKSGWILVFVAFAAAACAPAAQPTPTTEPSATPGVEASLPTVEFTAATVTPAPEMTEGAPVTSANEGEGEGDVAEAVNRPAWQTVALTNARTGETFTLADFAGRTVFVEPMATWCTNCRAQQRIVTDVYNQVSADEYVFLSLSVAESVSNEALVQYAEREGFPWVFAFATQDMLAALTEAFGRTVTTPPATPHFIIRPDGSYTELSTGQHSAEQLLAQLTEASGA